MDLRSYDPAIGRFNGIDPVTHHSQGTSVAFDNNPIFFADPSGADGTTFINDGSTGFANAWNSLKQESKTWSDNSGGCDDCSKCPETCNDNDPPIKTEHLDEVFITNLKRSAVHKDFNWTGDPKTDWLNYIAYKSYWSNHFKGFSQAFDAGWKSWMPGDLGYDVMNYTSGAIAGVMTLPFLSGAGASAGFGGLGDKALTLAARGYLRYQISTGSVVGGSGTTVLLGRYMNDVINPLARSQGYTTITNSLPALRSLTMPYNRVWLQYHFTSGSNILMHVNSNSGSYSPYMQMEIRLLFQLYSK